jgi:hypothetical protein
MKTKKLDTAGAVNQDDRWTGNRIARCRSRIHGLEGDVVVAGFMRTLKICAAGWFFLLVLAGGACSGARAGEPALLPASEPAGIDYRAEMIRLVTAIAQRGRQVNPDFGVFPQNGSELGVSAEYLAVVTGIGQEDIYYGYLRDGKATPREDALYLEANLDHFRDAGKRVLTLDYPFSNKNNPSFNKSTRMISGNGDNKIQADK